MDPRTLLRSPWCCWLVLFGPILACSPADSGDEVLHVFAASSLTEAFGDLGSAFEAAHPGTELSLSFAGSQVLRMQIEQGAPADLFASADPRHVLALVEAGQLRSPRVFARNELVLIVPLDNPAEIAAFEDLPRARRLVIGTKQVPVGSYSREVLRRADAVLGAGFEEAVLTRVVSEENNVRLLRAKVELGEADAAIVYRTDAAASERVRSIPIPSEIQVPAAYSIAVIEGSRHPEPVERWLRLLFSEEGRALLAHRGFLVVP